MRLWRRPKDEKLPREQKRLKLGTGSFWLESVALPLGVLTLQALPLGALLLLGAAWVAHDAGQALLPTWALLLLLAEAFYVSRWLTRQPKLRLWMALPVGIAVLVTLWFVLYLRLYANSGPFWQVTWLDDLFQDLQFGSGRTGAPVGAVIVLALLWWRGLRLGRDTLDHAQVSRDFKVGFAVLVAALLLSGTAVAGARDGLIVQLGLMLPIDLFVGLVALSLARLAEIRRARRAQGKTQADPTRFWVVAMLVLSGVLVVLLLGIEQAFSYHTLLGVFAAFGVVWNGISDVLGWLAVGLGFLLLWIYTPISDLFHLLFKTQRNTTTQKTQPAPKNPLLLNKHGGNALPTEWLVIGQWVLIALGVLLLLVIVIRAVRGFAAWRHVESTDEERESLGAANVLGGQLRALLANLAARFQRKPAAEDEADTLASHSVRALYRRVLRQTAAQGLGRYATETPQEFAERLGPVVSLAPALDGAPGASNADLETLTRAYEQARYGDSELPAAQVAGLTSGVERLLQRLPQQTRPPGMQEKKK